PSVGTKPARSTTRMKPATAATTSRAFTAPARSVATPPSPASAGAALAPCHARTRPKRTRSPATRRGKSAGPGCPSGSSGNGRVRAYAAAPRRAAAPPETTSARRTAALLREPDFLHEGPHGGVALPHEDRERLRVLVQ